MNEANQSANGLVEALTPRELDMLAHLAANRGNAEIAEKESLALSSVKWYVNQIFSKLSVGSRAEAVKRAQELGLFKTSPPPRNNLPRSLTSFIGREAEIGQLLRLVRAHPLVTVTGVGGTGKTRLALRTAEKALPYFPDGVWLVELAPLADRELVPQAVVSALGLAETRGLLPVEALVDFLRPKLALILLDNCEHVIGAAAGLAHELLMACPRLHILATSREILGSEGEIPFRCPSLPLPDSKEALPTAELIRVESIKLFVERAQIPSPGFRLTDANAALAAHICRRLDGIPLAIELAAARLRLLSIEQIAARLDDTFRLLTGGSRTDLPRHQTLKALIDWSYNLLSEKERLLLLRLSVFAGGWTIEAAEAVCADETLPQEDVLDLLGQLLDKSLAGMEAGTKSGQTRYTMLETIRQYAHERLVENGGGAEVRERHLDYYLDLSLRAEPELRRKNLRWWRDMLDEEIDNLRLAVEWALSGSLEKGMRLTAALARYQETRFNSGGVDWLQRLLATEEEGTPEQRAQPERRAARGKALSALALIANWLINRTTLAREAAEIFESLSPMYQLDWALALSMWKPYDPRPLDVIRQTGDPFRITETLWPLIITAFSRGELALARVYTEESLALSHQVEYSTGEMVLTGFLCWLELLNGNRARAEEWADASLNYDLAAGKLRADFGVLLQGWIQMSAGETPQAITIFEELLASARTENNHAGVVLYLGMLARAVSASGDLTLAGVYLEEANRFGTEVSDAWMSFARYSHARLAITRGEYELAFERLQFLTEHWYADPQFNPVQLLLQAFGILAAAQGQHRRAAVLFGAQDFIAHNLMNISSPREREEYLHALEAARAGLGEEEFARAMDEGRGMSLEEALRFAVEDRQ